MGSLLKIAVVIVIAILLTSSVYVIFFTDEDKDNEPPTIDTIAGNTTGTAGKITTIYVTFSDNIGVTEAILYYKTASEESWRSTSIINGSADIVLPSNSKENSQYYVTVNDAANNGPIGNPSTDGSSYYIITVSEDEDDEDLAHYVFVEEGTVTWCYNCPYAAEILHDLYDPDDPDFYYVSLVGDKNNKARERLENDYNIYGFPTVFIDGGYEIVMGKKDKSFFKDKISSAASREVPRLYLNVDAEWNKSREELTTTVTVENKETETYRGHLRVYITEINSRWSDWEGHPYHFGFLGYAINKPVEIGKNSEKTFSEEWQAGTSGYSNVYSENLFVIAVIFSSESTQKFSDPPENEHPFDAHYADAANATRVVEGKLPPSIGICYPKKGLRYILGYTNEKRRTLTGNTVIIGRITIRTCIEADLSIEKVEFIVKGRLGEIKETIYEEPYEWTWDKFAFGKYTITVKVYDKEGRSETDSIDVIAFILGEKFI
jgi:glutaredoxin